MTEQLQLPFENYAPTRADGKTLFVTGNDVDRQTSIDAAIATAARVREEKAHRYEATVPQHVLRAFGGSPPSRRFRAARRY